VHRRRKERQEAMCIRKRTLAPWGIAVVSLALLFGVLGMPTTARSARAQDDLCEKYQQTVDTLNRGEPDFTNFADDIVFVGGPACSPEECVGKDAYRIYIEYLIALDAQLTITSCEISGNTVAVTFEVRGWHDQAAGVDRIIIRETLEFKGDKVASDRLAGYDTADSQTATFLKWWLTARPGGTLAMGPGRDADQSPGKAVLELYPEFSAVSVRIKSGPTGVPQPVNIHKGTCADLGPVAFALRDMAGGVSQTVLKGVAGSDLQTGNYAIVVQKSEDEPNAFVACGDIPAAAPAAPPVAPAPAPEVVIAPAPPVTGSGGTLGEERSGVGAWWYALAAGGALLLAGGALYARRLRLRR
jgi:hypothetical protein